MSTPKVWDRPAIGAEVRRQGKTYAGIAEDAGLSESACRKGVLGYSRKGAEALARSLGVPFRELFPTSYTRGRRDEEKTSRTRPASESTKQRGHADTARGVA